jgi:PKHD-type hydroxylase
VLLILTILNKMLTHRTILKSNLMLPYAYANSVFSSKQIEAIIHLGQSLDLQTGAIMKDQNNNLRSEVDENIRTSKTAFINMDTESSWIFERLDEVLTALNNEYYQMDVWGYDHIQYSEYRAEDKGEYNWHMDTNTGAENKESSGGIRKLSATLLLNDDFEGGDFQMNLSSEKKPSTIEMAAGTLILFPSIFLHRVAPVTLNTRKSLVLWLLGNKYI